MSHSTTNGSEQKVHTEQRRIVFDSTGAATSYANTCHVGSTKEEIILHFGLNQAWEQGKQDVRVQVTNRIILSPFAAKRLALLLGAVVQQYERQFGVLDHGGSTAGPAPQSTKGSERQPANGEDLGS